MIKKLRRRFVIINMSFIFIILLIAFSFLYFYTEKRLSNESMQILHKVAVVTFIYTTALTDVSAA